MSNLIKAAILMAAITALFTAIGSLIGGQSGLLLALVVALGMNFFSCWRGRPAERVRHRSRPRERRGGRDHRHPARAERVRAALLAPLAPLAASVIQMAIGRVERLLTMA